MAETDRRRSPRIEVLEDVRGEVVPLDLAVTVRNVSLHGVGMHSGRAFEVGAIHPLRLTLGDGSFVVVRGRIAYCHNVAPAGATPAYATGVQFVDDPPADPAVDEIILKIAPDTPRRG